MVPRPIFSSFITYPIRRFEILIIFYRAMTTDNNIPMTRGRTYYRCTSCYSNRIHHNIYYNNDNYHNVYINW